MRTRYELQIRMKRRVFIERLIKDLKFKRMRRKSEMAKYFTPPEYYRLGDIVVSVPPKGQHGQQLSIFKGKVQRRLDSYSAAWGELFKNKD